MPSLFASRISVSFAPRTLRYKAEYSPAHGFNRFEQKVTARCTGPVRRGFSCHGATPSLALYGTEASDTAFASRPASNGNRRLSRTRGLRRGKHIKGLSPPRTSAIFRDTSRLGDHMLSDALGDLLQRARKQLALSRQELAARAKVSTRLVAELERGQRPNVSLESTLLLLNLVGVSIVAKAPDGATVEIRDPISHSLERATRAEVRRRTWKGKRVGLHDEGASPAAGGSPATRLSAVSQVSRQAFGLSRADRTTRERPMGR